MKKEIYLLGIGNYTEVIIELALDCGYNVKGLYHFDDSKSNETIFGYKVLGSYDELFKEKLNNKNYAVTIGDNSLREKIANQIRELGGITPNLIHPKSIVHKSCTMGIGCFIHQNAYLWTKAKIGNDCVISPNALLAHHSVVGNSCSVAPFSCVGPYSLSGNRVQYGISSVVLPKKITIGDDCTIGAKANVTKSFGDNVVLIGNPAKPIKKENQ